MYFVLCDYSYNLSLRRKFSNTGHNVSGQDDITTSAEWRMNDIPY